MKAKKNWKRAPRAAKSTAYDTLEWCKVRTLEAKYRAAAALRHYHDFGRMGWGDE